MLLNETTYTNRVEKQHVNVYFVFKALIKILDIYKKSCYFDVERGATFTVVQPWCNPKPFSSVPLATKVISYSSIPQLLRFIHKWRRTYPIS